MRKFRFDKLVRDKIVDGIKEAGNIPHHTKLSNKAFVEELKKKILEEALEIPNTKGKTELVEELADLQELIDNLLDAIAVSKKELLIIQKDKNRKRGSFTKRIFIDYVEAKADSEWIKYYLKNPDKYPEIK